MSVNCGVLYGLCAMRVTELDDDGNAEGSFSVSRNPITVQFNPNIDQGQVFTSRNGCGCSKEPAQVSGGFRQNSATLRKPIPRPK